LGKNTKKIFPVILYNTTAVYTEFNFSRLDLRLGVDDIALILQQNRLRWYGHVLQNDDDWVKKCMEHEVEGSRPRGRQKRTWKEVVREDCQARKLNKEDAMDRCKMEKGDKGSTLTRMGVSG